MMCFKDQTFCNDWCSNIDCFRNFEHCKEAITKELPICFFVNKPTDCTIWKPLENKSE